MLPYLGSTGNSPIADVESITNSTLVMARELVERIELALKLIDANGIEDLVEALPAGSATGTHSGAYTKEQLVAVIAMYRALIAWVTEPFGGTPYPPIVMLYKKWPAPGA